MSGSKAQKKKRWNPGYAHLCPAPGPFLGWKVMDRALGSNGKWHTRSAPFEVRSAADHFARLWREGHPDRDVGVFEMFTSEKERTEIQSQPKGGLLI